jgi:hypothetical protein
VVQGARQLLFVREIESKRRHRGKAVFDRPAISLPGTTWPSYWRTDCRVLTIADGPFDVVLIEAADRWRFIEELLLYQLGRRPRRPLRTHRGRHVVLNADGHQLHLDDELQTCLGPVELTIEPQSLTFLV